MKEEQVKVHMMAFEPQEGIVRNVTLPEDWREEYDNILNAVWHYGQNDFAIGPEKNTTCSVSVGDVVEHDGCLHIVQSCGFGEITPEQFEKYKKVPRRDRSFHPLAQG